MCTVYVKDGNIDQAIKFLRKKMEKEGIIKELRQRQYYRKPSVKKREKHLEVLKRINRKRKRRK